jgi:predicted ATPase/GAF domain-containing protein
MLELTGYTFSKTLYKTSSTWILRGVRDADALPVIAKFLCAEFPDRAEINTLKDEFELMEFLKLPGVCRSYCLEPHRHGLVLLMEDFKAVSLSDYLTEYSTAIGEVIEIGIAIVDILTGIHKKGIIHKALQPENILINPKTKEIKLTDFGSAHYGLRERQEAFYPETYAGCVYISPEQTGRVNRLLDFRTDFYSLGIIFYKMLTSRLPFDFHDQMELIHAHIAKLPTPLSEKKDNIPKVISDIVLKLLAKNPEDRYQSAEGLKTDLLKCRYLLKLNKGHIEYFEIAEFDQPERFMLPEKIYGRKEEIEFLFRQLNETVEGGNRLVLVSGIPGIGKTRLINEIQKPLVTSNGFLISGKFDQFSRTTPYSAVVQAFQGLIKQFLVESDQQLALRRTQFFDALGVNCRVIIDVIPELEFIVGKQPEVCELSPAESQNRFNLAFKNFISVLARKEHPLLLFLDDLQWADMASLALIKLLVTDPSITHLLILGACRSNEVDSLHPLTLIIDEIVLKGSFFTRLEVKPLKQKNINQMLRDLTGEFEKVDELGQLILQKTAGNPFFIDQFIRHLNDKDLLWVDPDIGWCWDIAGISNLKVTDNVVELLSEKIVELPDATRETLKICGCIGNIFELELLSIITEKSHGLLLSELAAAVNEGHIIRSGSTCFFLHDRIQEAAYALVSREERESLHFMIGRLYLEKIYEQNLEENIFAVVGQLNRCKNLINNNKYRRETAELNLIAGRKAKDSAAYDAAIVFLKTGTGLLEGDYWQKDYELTWQLYMERAICEYVTGEFKISKELTDQLMEKSKTDLERARIFLIRINLLINLGKNEEAVRIAIQGLEILGMQLSMRPSTLMVILELIKVRWYRGQRKLSQIIELPEMTDPFQLAIVNILNAVAPAAYFVGPKLMASVVLKVLCRIYRYGNPVYAAFAFSGMAFISTSVFGNYKVAHEYGHISLALNEKFGNPRFRCKSEFNFAYFIQHWRNHIKESVPFFRDAYKHALEVGEMTFAGYAVHNILLYGLYQGDNLNEIFTWYRRYDDFFKNLKDRYLWKISRDEIQMYLNLTGQTKNLTSLSSDDYDESKRILEVSTGDNKIEKCMFNFLRVRVFYLFGRHNECLEISEELDEIINITLGTMIEVEHYFYYSLILTSLFPVVPWQKKILFRLRLRKIMGKMKIWAKNCPENFRHKYLLIKAEIARVSDDYFLATDLYDQAIDSAAEHGFGHNEAIACELAGQMHLSKGFEEIARLYLTNAWHGYFQWGATAKSADLSEKYPDLIVPDGQAKNRNKEKQYPVIIPLTGKNITGNAEKLMKDSLAISEEIVLDKLIFRLLQMAMDNCKAEQGVFILKTDNQFMVMASKERRESKVNLGKPVSCQHSHYVPYSVISEVINSNSTVRIDDVSYRRQYADDQYIQRHLPKSILCIPIFHRKNLLAIFYLENRTIPGAFNSDQENILIMLAAQAAISIQNSYYAEELEKRVWQRTDELKEIGHIQQQTKLKLEEATKAADRATKEKNQFLASMSHDIRNPLNAVIGAAELALGCKLDSKLRRYLGIINSSGCSLLNLLDDIIDFSKIESGKLVIENQPFQLPELLGRLKDIFAHKAEEKKY